MTIIIIGNHGFKHSTVGAHYRGSSYEHGMSRLMNGVKIGEVSIVSYTIDSYANAVQSLDVEGAFDDVFDKLGYAYETVYSDNSMLVWFGVQTKTPQIMIDEVMKKIRDCEYLAGLSVSFGKQTFVV